MTNTPENIEREKESDIHKLRMHTLQHPKNVCVGVISNLVCESVESEKNNQFRAYSLIANHVNRSLVRLSV